LEPFAYLRDVLSCLAAPSAAEALSDLLPDAGLRQHPAAHRRQPR